MYFYPTVDHQKSCDSCDDNGMNGDLVVVYDVMRNTSLGDIMVPKLFHFISNIKYIFSHFILSSSHQTFFVAPPPEIR